MTSTKSTLLTCFVVGAIVDIAGAAGLAAPAWQAKVAGALALVAGTALIVGEAVHNHLVEKKGAEQVKRRFGYCCAACASKWSDMDAAYGHFHRTYPED